MSWQELEQLIEASRDVTSASAAEDLTEVYTQEIARHGRAWRIWLAVLVAAVLLAGGGGALTIALLHPGEGASNGEIASAVATELLVVGLLLYLVRVAARQFNSHRHLEAVARSKAAALATFNRIVAGPSEPEVRTAVAAAVAQAVFSSDDTGLIDASSENVTLIERVATPVVQRLTP
jgi:hypothetical protein